MQTLSNVCSKIPRALQIRALRSEPRDKKNHDIRDISQNGKLRLAWGDGGLITCSKGIGIRPMQRWNSFKNSWVHA